MQCKTCKVISRFSGKKFLMPLLGHRYSIITLEAVRVHVSDLDLEIGGGLETRGWTSNDIDVNGTRADVSVFAKRLKQNGIEHPVHYCGPHTGHSHVLCALNGIKLALTGRGY
ncbi:MAG: hypothetical protein Q7S50_04830 [bacterium]|nr:hypothetical protein [bacterium]